MKQFVLVEKATHTVFRCPIIECESGEMINNVGGTMLYTHYFCDVTGTEFIDAIGCFTKTTRTPPEGETIDPKASCVEVSGGTWA